MTTTNTTGIDPDTQCPDHGCSRWRCDESHPGEDRAGIGTVTAELKRLGAWGADRIECEAGEQPGTVAIYDAQVRSIYRTEDVVRVLSAASAGDWDGGGFEAAWQALGGLDEVSEIAEVK